MARIWFHQNAGGDFDPVTGAEDPNTGYPNRCLPGDPLCAEPTLLFDFGFDNFVGFPNIHDVGLGRVWYGAITASDLAER